MEGAQGVSVGVQLNLGIRFGRDKSAGAGRERAIEHLPL
jgi:hypothetical protein